jgi:hypothetical protein
MQRRAARGVRFAEAAADRDRDEDDDGDADARDPAWAALPAAAHAGWPWWARALGSVWDDAPPAAATHDVLAAMRPGDLLFFAGNGVFSMAQQLMPGGRHVSHVGVVNVIDGRRWLIEMIATPSGLRDRATGRRQKLGAVALPLVPRLAEYLCGVGYAVYYCRLGPAPPADAAARLDAFARRTAATPYSLPPAVALQAALPNAGCGALDVLVPPPRRGTFCSAHAAAALEDAGVKAPGIGCHLFTPAEMYAGDMPLVAPYVYERPYQLL